MSPQTWTMARQQRGPLWAPGLGGLGLTHLPVRGLGPPQTPARRWSWARSDGALKPRGGNVENRQGPWLAVALRAQPPAAPLLPPQVSLNHKKQSRGSRACGPTREITQFLEYTQSPEGAGPPHDSSCSRMQRCSVEAPVSPSGQPAGREGEGSHPQPLPWRSRCWRDATPRRGPRRRPRSSGKLQPCCPLPRGPGPPCGKSCHRGPAGPAIPAPTPGVHSVKATPSGKKGEPIRASRMLPLPGPPQGTVLGPEILLCAQRDVVSMK